MQQNKVAALENEANVDIETEKLKCRSEVAVCVMQQVKSQVKVMEFFKACTNRSLNSSVLTEKLKFLRTEVIDLQRNLRVLKDGANNAEVIIIFIIILALYPGPNPVSLLWGMETWALNKAFEIYPQTLDYWEGNQYMYKFFVDCQQ